GDLLGRTDGPDALPVLPDLRSHVLPPLWWVVAGVVAGGVPGVTLPVGRPRWAPVRRRSLLLLDDLLLVGVLGLRAVALLGPQRHVVVRRADEGRPEAVEGLRQRLLGRVLPVLALAQRVEQVLVVAVHVVDELGLEAGDVPHRDVVQSAGAPGPDGDDLVLDRVRVGLL